MIDVRSLSVRVGDLVIPAWRRLVSALEQLQVLPGVGVLVTRSPRGTIVNSRAALKGFIGSWAVSIAGNKATVGEGYVNASPPQKPKKNEIILSHDKYDKDGRSWIVLEVRVNDGGLLDPKSITLLQSDHPYRTGDRLAGRTPLVVLVKKSAASKAGWGTLHRIAYFDYQHRYREGRHFFTV